MSSGYRALAAAVITRAIKDANGQVDGTEDGAVSRTERRSIYQDARAFLRPDNERLAYWCEVVDLDPSALCEAIRRNGANFVRRTKRGEGR